MQEQTRQTQSYYLELAAQLGRQDNQTVTHSKRKQGKKDTFFESVGQSHLTCGGSLFEGHLSQGLKEGRWAGDERAAAVCVQPWLRLHC